MPRQVKDLAQGHRAGYDSESVALITSLNHLITRISYAELIFVQVTKKKNFFVKPHLNWLKQIFWLTENSRYITGSKCGFMKCLKFCHRDSVSLCQLCFLCGAPLRQAPLPVRTAASLRTLHSEGTQLARKHEFLFQYPQPRFHCASLAQISPCDLKAKGMQCAN